MPTPRFERENLQKGFAYLQQEKGLTPQFINTLTWPEYQNYFASYEKEEYMVAEFEACRRAFAKLTPLQRIELQQIKLNRL